MPSTLLLPPDSHKEYGLKVLKLEKLCCIEKPLAPNYNDCLVICEAFESKKHSLFVAYYRRVRYLALIKLKKWIDNNNIGTIRNIRWHLSKPASPLDLSKTTIGAPMQL